MDFSTPARTKHPNTCHNTSFPEVPCTPTVPPSSAPLRTGSERVVGASATVQEEQSDYSAFTMASSTPTPLTNITPIRVRPTIDDDDSRKRKSLSTPTRPTNLSNESTIPLNPPFSRPRVANPYLKTARSNVFPVASTPQPKAAPAASVTPGSSAKKQRATSTGYTTPKSAGLKKKGGKFIMSTYELYAPFREHLLLDCDKTQSNTVDDDIQSDKDVVTDVPPQIDESDVFFDAAQDADDDIVGDSLDAEDVNLDADLDNAMKAKVTVDADADVDSTNTAEFDTKAFSLMRNHFIHTRITTKQNQASDRGRSLRSDLAANDFNKECDTDATNVTTTDTRRLSRYMLEDFVTLPASTPLLLMIPTTNSPWSELAKMGFNCQNDAAIVRMGGIAFYKVTGHILSANLALDLTSGYLSESQLRTCFKQNDGVSIQIEGVSSFQLSWKQFISNPNDILIFGAPLASNRDFYRWFRTVNTMTSLHKMWRQLYQETFGDGFQCLLVYSSYLKRRCEIREKANAALSESASKYNGISSSIAILINKKDGLLKRFNTRCCNGISNTITTFQDFSKRLITIEEIDKFVQLVKLRASALFQVFATLRKIDYIRKKNKHLIKIRERQVFFQILAMFNQRCKVGTDWAAILSIAKKGWGLGKLAASVDSYFGVEISQSTYATRIEAWTKGMRETLCKYLSAFRSLVLAFDNCQEGTQLTHQRGGKSSRFKKATSRIARLVVRYLDFTFNTIPHCNTTYVDQIIPSPVGMYNFESISIERYDCILMNNQITSDNEPEFKGNRVHAYMDLVFSSDILTTVDHVVAHDSVASHIPPSLNTVWRSNYPALFKKQRGKLLLCAKQFQKKTVLTWNPQIGEATKLLILPVTPIDESNSEGAGAVVLQLLLESGVLLAMPNGSWDLAPDYEERLIYIFGDCKSNDNFLNFIRKMQTRKLSHDETQEQAEIFLKALSCVIEGPGDWHGGQAMLQALFTLFYGGLLQPMQVALGWKRIGDQVKDCYYGASRLLLFVLAQVERLLMDMLIAKLGQAFLDTHVEDDLRATYQFSSEFKLFVEDLMKSDDEWQRYLAHFYLLAREFRIYCKSCREGDSITVEFLYNTWAPIWKELGQHRYTEVSFRQIETLYKRIQFSTLQEFRCNRFIRMYASRRCMSTDEFVELVNKWMKDLKPSKTAQTWAEVTKMLGVMRRCIHFVKATYTQSANEVNCTPKSSTAPSMTPEKQIIYEMLVLSNAHEYKQGREMTSKVLFDVISKCTTVLTRSDLGKERHTDTTLEDLLSSVAQVSADDIVDDTDISEGEFASFNDAAERNSESEKDDCTVMNDGTKVKKRGVNKLSLKNIRCVGIEKLKTGKIAMVRKKQEARHQRAITAMREMNVHVSEMTKGVNSLTIQKENENADSPTWWQEQVRFAREQSWKTNIV